MVAELGGTISGEHGIGHKRKDYIHIVLSDREIEFMKKDKESLRPQPHLKPREDI